MAAKFVTLTLNPAVDRSGTVRGLAPTEKLRCEDPRTDPGGGGINVARVLTRLGADVTAIFPTGGFTGGLLTSLLEKEKLVFEAIPVPGETRESFHLRDLLDGAQYRFVFPGPALNPADIEKCCGRAVALAGRGSWLIASGSLPPGASPDTYGALARAAAAGGARVALDCSGAGLLQALGPALEIAKLNEAELQSLSGATVRDRERCVAAARQLLASGLKMVAVTRGARGALLVTAADAWEASAPPVRPASTVGAGDSFLAALVWSLDTGKTPAEALRVAVAAGAAALLAPGTGLAMPAEITHLLPATTVGPANHRTPAFAGV